jgi:hypothetical protein
MLAATKAEVCAIVNTLHISGFGVTRTYVVLRRVRPKVHEENIYCFHHTYEMYAKLTAATIVRITRQPPKRAFQYVPIAIPKANIPNLKRPVCHHFNVRVLKMFMGRAILRTIKP